MGSQNIPRFSVRNWLPPSGGISGSVSHFLESWPNAGMAGLLIGAGPRRRSAS